ncbi:dihydrofolate reductase family protein [Aestuariibaculum sediminum]|uniref:Dihydrofolate reductase n=1 Tax=Aestuariibaculum sediminum TaxID=2770637 RepID=A0A8J6QEW7_9FLAO|nr:dihydrofolate reductase family protein [Aestuariibaculum sediminum]MBD0830619.1 dihydrofolate reductase [Aestuariibaculum sediminum]
MKTQNKVFIATSLDGFIANKNGGVEWLESIPNPDQVDMGYLEFIKHIDALIMGRNTFEKVLSFGIEWPYSRPVFVLSNTLNSVPEKYTDKVFLVKGLLKDVLKHIHQQGFYNLYIDGGHVIQNFLNENLIDEMIISIVPIILGDGIPLFAKTSRPLYFKCISTKIYLDNIVQNHFIRIS